MLYGNLELFVFLDTCDLWVKDADGILHMLPKSAKIQEKMINRFRSLSHNAMLKGIPVTVLEIPAICIQEEWNKQDGHENPKVSQMMIYQLT